MRTSKSSGASGAEDGRSLRIGELAERAGVSTRTLRYYDELGLLSPSAHSPGGARRYGEADAERLSRILELKDLLGFNLEEIGTILHSEDRLSELRAEFHGSDPRGQERILEEAIVLNNQLREAVRAKVGRIDDFLTALEDKAARYRQLRRELRTASSR